MSGLINKAKAAVSSNKSHNNAHIDNPQSTNAGPHKSEMMNKIDPRVDSDRDHRNDPTSHAGGQGFAQPSHNTYTTGTHATGGHALGTHGAGVHTAAPGTTTHTTGTHAGTGLHGTHGSSATPGSGTATNAGPHNSAVMNKLDPRVDSDMDASRTTGGNATMR